MSIDLTLKGAKELAAGLWQATIDPASVRMLGSGHVMGDVSVLLLIGPHSFDAKGKTLTVGLADVQVLNVGGTDNAVLVAAALSADGASAGAGPRDMGAGTIDRLLSRSASSAPSSWRYPPRDREVTRGDSVFLERLPRNLKELGEQFLQAVRQHFNGVLVFHHRSEKFVESPDNFWTARIQPRDQSLRITVRGVPESFAPTKLIELKPDMGTYSAFKVASIDQIPEAIEVLQQAARK